DISYIDNDINFVSTSTVSTESTALSGSCPTSSASTYSTASSVSG
ncbi:TPA: thiocillin family RiPP, partial [Staphylococcus delphini]|nr:thiocillin family RiPP [Staphylococcus delphini]